jgi:hypothetical protein
VVDLEDNMTIPRSSMLLAVLFAALAVAPVAEAGLVTDLGSNGTLATAQSIDGSFTLDFSADIGNAAGLNTSTSMPHVTIQGTGDGTFDYYSFTVAGTSLAIFDIDYGKTPGQPGSMDTMIAVWAADGTLVAYDDDEWNLGAGAGGSVHGYDSFLQLELTAGLYVVGVSEYWTTALATGGWGRCSNPPDLGDTYTLQVSVADPVPEPMTLTLFGSGLLGLGVLRRRRR